MRIHKETRKIIENIVRGNTVIAAEDIDFLIKSREDPPDIEVLINREIAKTRNTAVARIKDGRNRRIAFILAGSEKMGIGSLIVNIERSKDKRAFKTISDRLKKKADGIKKSWDKIQKKREIEEQISL